MIIFTVTNKVTSQVYVGSTRNNLKSQWEKMVAAADQNIDYPLYREICSYGYDSFQVEEWDFTDDRSELAQLESEAMESLNAKSLKGYKTSTVKIQPKKKVRQRKSSIEKELASLFAELPEDNASEDTSTPAAMTLAANSNKQPENKNSSPAQSVQKTPASKPLASAIIESVFSQEAPAKKEQFTKSEQPVSGSQANAIAYLTDINLSDNMTAQLAAIQAAADAAIAGDISAAAEPCTSQIDVLQTDELSTEATVQVTSNSPTAKIEAEQKIEVKVELSPKEQKIRDAIKQHRLGRAQKSSEAAATEKQQIATLLAQMEAKAASLQTITLAVAA